MDGKSRNRSFSIVIVIVEKELRVKCQLYPMAHCTTLPAPLHNPRQLNSTFPSSNTARLHCYLIQLAAQPLPPHSDSIPSPRRFPSPCSSLLHVTLPLHGIFPLSLPP